MRKLFILLVIVLGVIVLYEAGGREWASAQAQSFLLEKAGRRVREELKKRKVSQHLAEAGRQVIQEKLHRRKRGISPHPEKGASLWLVLKEAELSQTLSETLGEEIEVKVVPQEVRLKAVVNLLGKKLPLQLTGGVRSEGETLFFVPKGGQVLGRVLDQKEIATLLGDEKLNLSLSLPEGWQVEEVALRAGEVRVHGVYQP